MVLDLKETFIVGEDTFLDSFSPTNSFGVVFEDDLRTGYLYAVIRDPNLRILDALHIYNVDNVIDKHKPSQLQIFWTDDGLVASLLINNYCHAIFDFQNKAGYSRNAFPESNREWAVINDRRLTDEFISSLEGR